MSETAENPKATAARRPRSALNAEARAELKKQMEGAEYFALSFFAQQDFGLASEQVVIWTALRWMLDGKDASTGGYQNESPFKFLAAAAAERLAQQSAEYRATQATEGK